MAFTNGLQSPRDESNFQTYPSPMRTVSSQYVPQLPSTSAERASLNRRFTTNAVTTLPTLGSLQSPLSPIGQQRRQAAEQHDYNTTGNQRPQSQLQREREQRELAEKIKRSSLAARKEAERLEEQYRLLTSPAGRASEPTTPPEVQDSSLSSTAFTARPNRFSLGLTSPLQPSTTTSFHRNTLSGSHHSLGLFGYSSPQTLGQSHRNSDEEQEEDAFNTQQVPLNRRAAVRNSMPVTNFEYRGMSPLPDVGDVLGINSLLDDDDDYRLPSHRHAASIDRPSTLHLEPNEDDFLFLNRQGESSNSTMANSALLNSSDANGLNSGGWPNYSRHRQGQKSLPMNTLRATEDEIGSASHSRNSSVFETPSRNKVNNNRHSMDVNYAAQAAPHSNRSSIHLSPPSNAMPNLRSSLSTNDIPTIGSLSLNDPPTANNMTHEQRLHNHNATLGRIPPSAVGHRREASIGDRRSLANQNPIIASTAAYLSSVSASAQPSYSSTTTAASTPYSSGYTTSASANVSGNMQYSSIGASAMPSHGTPTAIGRSTSFGGNSAISPVQYGVQQPGQQIHQAQWNNTTAMPYGNYNHYYYQQQYQVPRPRDSQQWVIAQRRGQKNDDAMRGDNRFTNTSIEEHIGKIFEVSKDQNGCRYLQKKIEEDKAKNLPIIFNETKEHIVELMKDPFGNYLCQKLLENCNEQQRAVLINNAAPSMVDIAINQHGTRALQKMIEFIHSPEDVDVIVHALSQRVVDLIQDLNGNHVVQKCLNHLRPDDAQFIFDAVGAHALIVGTHRHGCCVLQRCIDHATGPQKDKLVHEITQSAYTLMQDAYGNYVIQYILDLNDAKYTGPLCRCFETQVVELSRQKFSSNVIEKSIRMADPQHQHFMVEELCIESSELEKLLRDPFANYVVQTALEHGPAELQDRLWEIIKPILGNLRATPCGRRLSQKLAQREGNRSGHTSGSMTPKEGVMTPINLGSVHSGNFANHFNPGPPAHNMASGHTMAGAMPYRHKPNGGNIPTINNIAPHAPHAPHAQHTQHAQHAQHPNQSHSRNAPYVQYPNGFF